MEEFREELYQHLKAFRPKQFPKLAVTTTGHPRAGLGVAYRSGKKPAGPEEIVKEVSRFGASGTAGAAVGAVSGVVIGKLVFGTTVARVGVASAGVGVGVPVLAPLALAGALVGTAAYGMYRLGRWKADKEVADAFAKDLVTHMNRFVPSVQWPSVEIYLSLPELGLSALWQPRMEEE